MAHTRATHPVHAAELDPVDIERVVEADHATLILESFGWWWSRFRNCCLASLAGASLLFPLRRGERVDAFLLIAGAAQSGCMLLVNLFKDLSTKHCNPSHVALGLLRLFS